ncbi:MAG: GNAT family N-acetyltransferase, partial [Dehalococcoidia bacterium]
PFYHDDDFDNIEGVYLIAGGAFWVLEHANEVVAFGGVLRIDDTTARLRRFRVRADWRRRGLATLLLTKAERFCRERGYTTITLGTTDVQQAAQALYRKHGYVEVGEQWLRDDLREIEFAKELP